MKFIGIELRNFRSIGDESVSLMPLKKCTILVGQNNSGKSNVIRAIKKVSDWGRNHNPHLEELDLHNRIAKDPFSYTIYLQTQDDEVEKKIRGFGFDQVWFTASEDISSGKITDNVFAHLTDFHISDEILQIIARERWTRRASQEEIHDKFINSGSRYFEKYKGSIPQVEIIPEFRQIRQGENYKFDGENLIGLLGNYQLPDIGQDQNQEKFERIQEFVRKLLQMPHAFLEVSRPGAVLIIRNDGLRLPLSSFGTGVHELIILVTATLAIEGSICCIEEPEVHLHPRLQRELLDFLIHETSNQYIISTHSPALINAFNDEDDLQILHLKNINGVTKAETITHERQIHTAFQDLGLKPSDLLQANCIIWVEGQSDRNYISRWLKILAPDLLEGRDFVFFTYSERLKLNMNHSNFETDMTNVFSINRNAIYIADSDRQSRSESCNQQKTNLSKQCEEGGGLGWITDGREIENYIPSKVIQKFVLEMCHLDIEIKIGLFEKISDVIDRFLKKANGKPIKYSDQKTNYSRKLAELFTKEDIQDELASHLESIISKIRGWKE